MKTTQLVLQRMTIDHKPAIRIIVRNAYLVDGMTRLLNSLGIVPTIDIANQREITCFTADEINAAREPLRKYFDAQGIYNGTAVQL
mgnify:CR=1 FL=1